MTTGDDLWREEWLAEVAGDLHAMRGEIAQVTSSAAGPSPWRRIGRAWSRLAGQAAFFGESAVQAIGVEAASLCERVAQRPGLAPPDEAADVLAGALDLVDAAMRRKGDLPSDAEPIDDLLVTMRAMAPAGDPERDLRRLMGQARLLIDAWRAVSPDVSPSLAERVTALESTCDDITRDLADDAPTPLTTASPGAHAPSEIPVDWRRGVEQLATLRDELRDEHVSSKILGRFDAILRRLGSSIRVVADTPDGALRVLCVRVAERRFAIPKSFVESVRPARRPAGSRFAGDDVPLVAFDFSDTPAEDITLHVIVETGRGRVAIGVSEVTGEATLWNVGPSENPDPRFGRAGADADEREWEILRTEALAPDASTDAGEAGGDGRLASANGRARPNAAPLLRALSRGEGGR